MTKPRIFLAEHSSARKIRGFVPIGLPEHLIRGVRRSLKAGDTIPIPAYFARVYVSRAIDSVLLLVNNQKISFLTLEHVMKSKIIVFLALALSTSVQAKDASKETWIISDVIAADSTEAKMLCRNQCFILLIGQNQLGYRPMVTYKKSQLPKILRAFGVSHLYQLRYRRFSNGDAARFPVLKRLIQTAQKQCWHNDALSC